MSPVSIWWPSGRRRGPVEFEADRTYLKSMGDLQDPKLEVLYHIRPYFVGIFPYIGLI